MAHSSERGDHKKSKKHRHRSRSPSPHRERRPRRRSADRDREPRNAGQDGRRDAHRAGDANGGHSRGSRGRIPPRPDTRHVDDLVDKRSYDDFRRLKRLRLAQEPEFCIWGASPSPEPEPLLEPDPEENSAAAAAAAAAAGGAAAAAAKAVAEDPVLAALDQQELALFMTWLQERKAEMAADAEVARRAAEASRPVGPQLPAVAGANGAADGFAPNEADRANAFAPHGSRIPRRGEIGLTDGEIHAYESVGYVLSGNRRAQANAVKLRKESQVYSAEERAALAMFNAEEAKRKEELLVAEMKKMVEATVADGGGGGGA